MRRRGLVSLAWASVQDLFDQGTAFGRLALVHVVMMAGDTLVTVSLAGSLFFSVSPNEAKSKVLLYLLLTIAPFAVVSPVLGPLIDRSANGRRILVALSASVRVLLCWSMSQHLNSLWLFPAAFAVLISSKLYGVTRGAAAGRYSTALPNNLAAASSWAARSPGRWSPRSSRLTPSSTVGASGSPACSPQAASARATRSAVGAASNTARPSVR